MSDGSVNAALTYIAGQDASDLLVAASTPSMLGLLKSWGTPLAQDCTGMTSLHAYTLRGASKYDNNIISFQVSSQYSNLAEYAVFARAPTIEWQCTAKPPGAPDNWQDECVKKHPNGGAAAQRVVSTLWGEPRHQNRARLGPRVSIRCSAWRERILRTRLR